MKSHQINIYFTIFCLFLIFLSSCSSDKEINTAFRRIAILEEAKTLADSELLSFFSNTNPEIKKRAVIAAGRINDSSIVPDLVELLKDSRMEIREEAIFALGQIGDEVAVAPLIQYFSSSGNDEKILIIEALGKIGGEQAEEFLVQELNSLNAELVDNIIYALTWMKASDYLPQISARLTSTDPDVKRAAAYACYRMADSTFNIDIYRYLSSNDPLIRKHLIGAAGKAAHPRFKKSILPYLDDDDRYIRIEAIRAAGRTKLTEAVDILLAYAGDDNFHFYSEAINALGNIASKKAAQPLLNMIKIDSGEKTPYLVVALTKIEGDRFLPFLDTYSDHPEPAVRRAAAYCLSLIADPNALQLAHDMMEDSDPTVRTALVWGLQDFGKIGHALLLKSLNDEDWAVRTAAAEGIGKLNDADDFQVLKEIFLEHFDKTDSEESRTLLKILYKLAPDRTKPLLYQAIQSRKPAVGRLARKLLIDSGEDVPSIPAPPDAGYPDNFGLPAGYPSISVYTAKGRIEIELFGNEAPVIVENMLKLIRNRFYDNTVFHRIVPNFVVQGGDPRGDGWGGPGYTVNDQINHHKFEAGTVGLPTSGLDTGGCQFFICLTPQPHLDGRYTVFGKVTRGFEILLNLREGDIIEEIAISAKKDQPKYREM